MKPKMIIKRNSGHVSYLCVHVYTSVEKKNTVKRRLKTFIQENDNLSEGFRKVHYPGLPDLNVNGP